VLVRLNPVRRADLVGTALAVLTEEAEEDGWLRCGNSRRMAEALTSQWLRTSLRDRAAVIVARYDTPS